jgi:hypothetical protein
MGDLAPGWIALILAIQVTVFVALLLLGLKVLKVIKSQNNGMVLPPDLSAKLRNLFKRSGKS